eukprot:14518126-Ditylum_brightwellii.AAC.1
MHGQNNTHDTDNCFELNQRKKRAKSDTSRNGKDKVSYKDLNAFVNAKSSDEEGKLKESAPAADSNSKSEASRLLSDDSNSNVSA